MTTRIETEDVVAKAARAVMAILWRREQYNGVGPDYENYRESMGNRVARYEKEAEEAARAALSATPIERLREENARVVEAATFAHQTLVELKIARTLSVWAEVGGAAKAVSSVVNKLRAALTPSADDDK
jgi:hypothetical protein